ncbi:type II restriction enzyme [Bacillus niacini]|uniref:Type-2 restriction enzyme n=1 Tax=Neobacillus niacini TaxID=86668 RepID=A0A852TIL2_9BACI|nr:type II restriction endonuclease [Neobacillus niacini]NYE08820.1 type II restriction enzyme [Neobacillus niacini]
MLPYYSNRNLSNNEEAFGYLLNTLKDSIFTWDYFVDFDKVLGNIRLVEKELLILNRLLGLGQDEIEDIFTNLIMDYPKVRKVLPLLIASRLNKMAETPVIDDIKTMIAVNKKELFDPKVPLDENIINDLKVFFNLTGLKRFFVYKEVSNLVDYCKGIEAGMDTNARKNRTGTSMENLLEVYIKAFCAKNNFKYMSQATQSKLKDAWDISINVDKINRRFDFAIVDNYGKLTLIEVNYYSGGGSKLKATAGEYKEVQKFLSNQGIKFIWVTDGMGWHTARTALEETFILNDYTLNLQMISEGILDEIILLENKIKA